MHYAIVMPENPIPLRKQLTAELLHRLMEQHPKATLKELGQQLQREPGISISTTSMCHALLKPGLTYKLRRAQESRF